MKLLVAAVIASAVVALPAQAATGPSAKRAAKRALANKEFSTHQSGRVTNATIDRTADLCRNTRFTYTSVFFDAETGTDNTIKVTGHWRVSSASTDRHGHVTFARVRYTASDGTKGSVTFTYRHGTVRVNGLVAEVKRSPVC
jgi:hypothetical protein